MKNNLYGLIAGVLALTAADVSACTVCFKGDPSQSANVALRGGVLLLLGVIVSVLMVFAWFFVQVGRRSREGQD